MVSLVASASWAKAVIPTAVPLPAFSATPLAAAFTSLMAPTLNSSTSSRLMVKSWLTTEPSALAACTVMVCEALASKSSKDPSAMVTMPELLLMAKRPPAESIKV